MIFFLSYHVINKLCAQFFFELLHQYDVFEASFYVPPSFQRAAGSEAACTEEL